MSPLNIFGSFILERGVLSWKSACIIRDIEGVLGDIQMAELDLRRTANSIEVSRVRT